MGVAQSNNVASEISDVTTGVSNEINVSADFVNNVTQAVTLGCSIGGNVNIVAGMTNITKSRQISKLYTDTTITNTINQKMLQTAISKVGALGVGYADASNAATSYSNVSNQVKSTINQAVIAMSLLDQSFTCGPNATIGGNLNIDFDAGNSFIGEQKAASDQINKIANTVTQDIDQKASATVQGIGGLVMLIIIIIVMIVLGGLSSAKPAATEKSSNGGNSRFSNSTAASTGGVLLVLVGIVLMWGYIGQLPPFFASPQLGSPNSSSFVGGCRDGLILIQPRKIYLKTPPLRYSYPIIENGPKGSLLELAIIKVAGGSTNTLNGGLNGQNFKDQGASESKYEDWVHDDTGNLVMEADGTTPIGPLPNLLKLYKSSKDNTKYALIPDAYLGDVSNPLTDTSDYGSCVPGGFSCGSFFVCDKNDSYTDCNGNAGTLNCLDINIQDVSGIYLAVPNVTGWRKYMSTTKNSDDTETVGPVNPIRAKHARFILCKVLGIPLDVFVDDDEEVAFKDPSGIAQYGKGGSFNGQALKFGKFALWDYVSALPESSSGELTGDFGICDTKEQSFQRGANQYGIAVVISVFVLIFFGNIILQSSQHLKNPNRP